METRQNEGETGVKEVKEIKETTQEKAEKGKTETEKALEADTKRDAKQIDEIGSKKETGSKKEAGSKEEVGNKEAAKEIKKSRKRKKPILIGILIVLLLLLVVVYCWVANYYKTHFFQQTSINNVDCSNLMAAEVTALLDRKALDYQLEIIGRNSFAEEVSLGVIQAADMGYAYKDTLSGVNAILNQQNEWAWIFTLWDGARGYSLIQGITYEEEKLESALKALDAFQTSHMITPQNAYISDYSEKIGGYEIIPEVKGTKFDVNAAISCVKAAIIGNSSSDSVRVNLVEQGCYEEPKITSDDKEMVKAVQTINQWLGTEIEYDWNGSKEIVNNSIIKDWVSMENGTPKLDEDAVAAFVNGMALENDTYGKTARFTTALGIDINLKRLSYGWKTNREEETEELIKLIYDGAKESREPAYLRKGVWKGQSDIGNSYIEADLTHQHLYVYQKGSVVFETDFVSGNINQSGCATPSGIFGLTYKTRNAVLRGADYETPVNYWMPFYGNFGMHDATWRSEFGGDIYITNGSHGCLNLPLDAAAVIYDYVSEGSPIICYYVTT